MSVARNMDTDWHLVHCPRIATAPLRFTGRLIDRRAAGLEGYEFAVYERQRGGLAAVMPGWSRGAWRADAVRTNGWPDLFDEIETRFANLEAPPRGQMPVDAHLLAQTRFAVERDTVLFAVGAVLDHWQILAEHAGA